MGMGASNSIVLQAFIQSLFVQMRIPVTEPSHLSNSFHVNDQATGKALASAQLALWQKLVRHVEEKLEIKPLNLNNPFLKDRKEKEKDLTTERTLHQPGVCLRSDLGVMFRKTGRSPILCIPPNRYKPLHTFSSRLTIICLLRKRLDRTFCSAFF